MRSFGMAPWGVRLFQKEDEGSALQADAETKIDGLALLLGSALDQS